MPDIKTGLGYSGSSGASVRRCPRPTATRSSRRKVPRPAYEAAGDKARVITKMDAYVASRRERRKVEMLFAHLKRILGRFAPFAPPMRNAVAGGLKSPYSEIIIASLFYAFVSSRSAQLRLPT